MVSRHFPSPGINRAIAEPYLTWKFPTPAILPVILALYSQRTSSQFNGQSYFAHHANSTVSLETIASFTCGSLLTLFIAVHNRRPADLGRQFPQRLQRLFFFQHDIPRRDVRLAIEQASHDRRIFDVPSAVLGQVLTRLPHGANATITAAAAAAAATAALAATALAAALATTGGNPVPPRQCQGSSSGSGLGAVEKAAVVAEGVAMAGEQRVDGRAVAAVAVVVEEAVLVVQAEEVGLQEGRGQGFGVEEGGIDRGSGGVASDVDAVVGVRIVAVAGVGLVAADFLVGFPVGALAGAGAVEGGLAL